MARSFNYPTFWYLHPLQQFISPLDLPHSFNPNAMNCQINPTTHSKIAYSEHPKRLFIFCSDVNVTVRRMNFDFPADATQIL